MTLLLFLFITRSETLSSSPIRVSGFRLQMAVLNVHFAMALIGANCLREGMGLINYLY
jgi:hypothetical protein